MAGSSRGGEGADRAEASDAYVYGINPVLALLANADRAVESLVCLKGSHGNRFQGVVDLARERGLRPRFVDRATLDRMTGKGSHQGVVARAGVRKQPTFEDVLDRVEQTEGALLVLLDGMEDPRNLGAVIRSSEAFGALAVVLPRDRSAPLSSVAIKASAGAGERLDVVRVVNLVRAMDALQKRGVYVYGLTGEGERSLAHFPFTGSVALVLGGEGKGLRRLVREKCDELLAIPIGGLVGSLNVSVAAGIGLYEVQRSRVGA